MRKTQQTWIAAIGGFTLFILMSLSVFAETIDTLQAQHALDQALAESVLDEQGNIYRNAVIAIDAPKQNFTYSGAAGVARADTEEAMTVDHQFHIASMGKSMTAVIILQLWEEGMLGEHGLDATLEELEAFPDAVLDQLHVLDGVSYGRTITVRQLLQHTTGIKDYNKDDEHGIEEDYPDMGFALNSLTGIFMLDEEKGAEAMIRCVHEGLPEGCTPEDYYYGSSALSHWDYESWVQDPTNKLAGILNFYLGGMNRTPLFAPGEEMYYSNTNYVILGLLIEQLTGNSLHHELRTRIFDPLGMHASYETYATDPPASQWEKNVSDCWAEGQPLMSYHVNLSMDWAAGGEMSTVSDLTAYLRAIAKGDLFHHETTVQEMLKTPSVGARTYGCGIEVEQTEAGMILYHGGSYGSWMIYYPESNVVFVGTINDEDNSHARMFALQKQVYRILEQAGLTLPIPEYIKTHK
jgi:D-alanyl-D-alanine carboxypeptidase